MRRILLALATACIFAFAAAPVRADRVDAHVPLGTSADGQIASSGGAFTAAFLVNEGPKRNVSILVKRAKGETFAMDVKLFDPLGAEVDVVARGGKLKAKDKIYKAKLKDIGVTGMWRIEVRALGPETGGFTISLKGKDAAKLGGTDVVGVGGFRDIVFLGGDGAEVTLLVKRARGSAIVPDVEIYDSNGLLVPESAGAAAVNVKKGVAKLKGLVLPAFGSYSARVRGSDGTGGGFSYKVTTKASKLKGTRPDADPGAGFAVEPGNAGTLDGSASAGGGGLSFLWAQVHGPHVELDDPTSPTPSFVAPDADASVAFQLSVFAGLRSRPRLVVVEVAPRPIAIPGPSQRVDPGAQVALDATASIDVRGAGLVSTWRVISGGVTLDDPTSLTPAFTAPSAEGTVRLGLIVDDGRARSREVDQVVAVSATPTRLADAGRSQQVTRMATVFLSGLASERNGSPLEDGASWTQVAGETVTLSGADTFTPSFTAPRRPGDLRFELRIDGLAGTAHSAWVFVRDDLPGTPPTVTTQNFATASGGSAVLNATATTDPDGDSVSVRWAQIAGTPLAIATPTALQTAVTGATDPSGIWLVAVQAWDALAYGPPEHVRISSAGYAGLPFASAGVNRSVAATQIVGLDGAGSARTTGSGAMTYAWRQVSGLDWYDVDAEDPSFNPSAAQPQFALPADLSSLEPIRTLTFELAVFDGTAFSLPDLVTVRFSGFPLNGAPVVTAATDEPEPLGGDTVTLLGTANDRDGDTVTVRWQQISGPTVALVPSATVLEPTFTAPAAGAMTFRLTGNDGFDDSPPVTVDVDVNEPPVAVATVDPQDGPPGTMVTFSGATSSDPDQDTITYLWEQVSGTALMFPPDADEFTVTAPSGVFSFRLTVNDGRQDSLPVSVAFGSNPPPTVAPTASLTTAEYGAPVSLQANPAGGDTAGVTFTWRQISGPTTNLSSTTAQNPTFSVPLPNSTPFGGTSAALPTARFGVKATREGQDSVEVTIDVAYFASYNDPNNRTNTAVFTVIQQNCLSCHSTTSNNCSINGARKYGINGVGPFRTNSINVTSCASSKSYVVPGNPGQSFTLDRIKNVTGAGGPMPPSGSLGTANMNLIEDWISQGAQNN